MAPDAPRHIYRCWCETTFVSDRPDWGCNGRLYLLCDIAQLWVVGYGERERVLEHRVILFDARCGLHPRSVVHKGNGAESWWLGWLVVDNVLDRGLGKLNGGRLCKAGSHWK